MGRFKTNEERQRKIMKNKEFKKLTKLAKKGAVNEKNVAEVGGNYQDSSEGNDGNQR